MRIGAIVPQGWVGEYDGWDPLDAWRRTIEVARQADRLGFDSIWLFDHVHTTPTPRETITFEAYTTLAALAPLTRRVRMGQLVTCVGYRNPALVAKMASTLDVVSGGRTELGLGAGWKEEEYRAYGYDFPPLRVRLALLRDSLEIAHRMFGPGRATWAGEVASVNGAINEPKGVQQPHIPLWIGGGGEQVTLKLVAQYGAACNIGGDGPMKRHKLDVLRQHCETVGRDYGEIIKSAEAYLCIIEPGDDPVQATAQARGAQPGA